METLLASKALVLYGTWQTTVTWIKSNKQSPQPTVVFVPWFMVSISPENSGTSVFEFSGHMYKHNDLLLYLILAVSKIVKDQHSEALPQLNHKYLQTTLSNDTEKAVLCKYRLLSLRGRSWECLLRYVIIYLYKKILVNQLSSNDSKYTNSIHIHIYI